ncbi:MAG: DUF1801 domain-containing protein [Planctomycetaceae bacterium]
MRSTADTVAEYLAELTPERREAIQRLRLELKRHLDPLLEEVMQYGMITYVVPHRVYPPGYHCRPTDPLPFLSLASQKNNLALYVMAISMDRQLSAWLDKAWKATGRRLDRGECCIRFRSPDEIPFEVLAELLKKMDVRDYLRMYEISRKTSAKARGTKQTAGTKPKSPTRAAGHHHQAKTKPPGNSPAGNPQETEPAAPARRTNHRETEGGTATRRGKQPATGAKSRGTSKSAASPRRRSSRRSDRD